MLNMSERFVTDKSGNRTAVILDMEDYNLILQKLEELESIEAYDAAKFSGDKEIPFEKAVEEIERNR